MARLSLGVASGSLPGSVAAWAWQSSLGCAWVPIFFLPRGAKLFFFQEADLSVFDLIGLENKMTRHEAELLCKKKVTRKLMEELFAAPLPSGRPAALRLKPGRCVA